MKNLFLGLFHRLHRVRIISEFEGKKIQEIYISNVNSHDD